MRISFLLGLSLLAAFSTLLCAQTLEPRAVVPAGGAGNSVGGASLGWTLGQAASATYVGGSTLVTAGVQQPDGLLLYVNIAALLDGPYDATTDLMHDSLRTRGLLPLNEPFSAMGHLPVGLQGGAQLLPTALLTTGPDAVVDWVFVELRGADDNTRIDAARAALLQRDGDIVDVDGSSPLRIAAVPGAYHIALRHRNHLPVMSMMPVALASGANALDLTDGATPLHVPDARTVRDGRHLLWQGDVNADGTARYVGANNDRDPILVDIGGTAPTNVTSGYLPTDVNMDGTVKYVGADNDRDPILQTIGGTVPTAMRVQPLP